MPALTWFCREAEILLKFSALESIEARDIIFSPAEIACLCLQNFHCNWSLLTEVARSCWMSTGAVKRKWNHHWPGPTSYAGFSMQAGFSIPT